MAIKYCFGGSRLLDGDDFNALGIDSESRLDRQSEREQRRHVDRHCVTVAGLDLVFVDAHRAAALPRQRFQLANEIMKRNEDDGHCDIAVRTIPGS